jgi:short-subunit dehydrogenase involved in D-alanine esterification of teichoic acids
MIWAAVSIDNEVPVMNLHGTNVVIVGGSSGIGLATAKLVRATKQVCKRYSEN